MGIKLFSILALLSTSLATPLLRRTDGLHDPGHEHDYEKEAWAAGGTPDFPIHESCNSSEVIQLHEAIEDMYKVANHAIDHILRFGNESELFIKWFGASPSAQPIGWYERIIRSDRTGFLFRCDDPDHFCGPPDWSGYWRGLDVAPLDVAICPRYFELIPLGGLCTRGYTLANTEITLVQVTDLMHRLLHVPLISELVVEHYGNGYIGSLDLAKTTPEESVINSDSLQFFALEAYAVDIIGVDCVGDEDAAREAYSASMATATTAAATSSAVETAAATEAASQTTEAPACHTHANGEVHCI